jgi:hypothetical protein
MGRANCALPRTVLCALVVRQARTAVGTAASHAHALPSATPGARHHVLARASSLAIIHSFAHPPPSHYPSRRGGCSFGCSVIISRQSSLTHNGSGVNLWFEWKHRGHQQVFFFFFCTHVAIKKYFACNIVLFWWEHKMKMLTLFVIGHFKAADMHDL